MHAFMGTANKMPAEKWADAHPIHIRYKRRETTSVSCPFLAERADLRQIIVAIPFLLNTASPNSLEKPQDVQETRNEENRIVSFNLPCRVLALLFVSPLVSKCSYINYLLSNYKK